MIGLQHYLTLSAMLFVLSIAGIIINRRNLILLLMCIELMLLAVNMNFVAFSRFLGNLDGQVFVFFILTVAAAEAATPTIVTECAPARPICAPKSPATIAAASGARTMMR